MGSLAKMDDLRFLEWLEASGDGGFSSGVYSGQQNRRYHSYSIRSGDGGADEMRSSVLARVDEILYVGDLAFELSRRVFANGVQPDGSRFITAIEYTPWPKITYQLSTPEHGDLIFTKEITAIEKTRGVVLAYELGGMSGELQHECRLELELFFACCPYHQLPREREDFSCEVESFGEDRYCFKIQSEGDCLLNVQAPPGSSFHEDGDWYNDFYYQTEKERGYDFSGDLFRAGRLSFPIGSSQRSALHFSKISVSENQPQDLQQGEKERRAGLLPVGASPGSFYSELVLAADKFLVRTASGQTQIVAGFPWFVSWGRDTMISLSGICLVPSRYEEAKNLLTNWASYIKQGLIPNRLSTPEGPPDYNTADASLWYLVAAYRYFQYTKDKESLAEIFLPAAKEILQWHRTGTLYGIGVDSDGLLLAGSSSTQLTWMDAMYDGVPVTPRSGKAVEINALWVNALFITSYFCREMGESREAEALSKEACMLRESFLALFWRPQVGYFADCITGKVGEELSYDVSLRPNQLLALSLPVPLANQEQGKLVIQSVRQHLLTPVGLRTLSPLDPRYKGVYSGELAERDEAYHQGTVWPYLIGGYVTALKRYEAEQDFSSEAEEIYRGFESELRKGDVPGSLNEIYDGDAPHRPRGAFAQAWSVAEVLRSFVEDYQGIGPETMLDL